MSPKRTHGKPVLAHLRWPGQLALTGVAAAAAFLAEVLLNDAAMPPWLDMAVVAVGAGASALVVVLTQRGAGREVDRRVALERRFHWVLGRAVLPLLQLQAKVIAAPTEENRGQLVQSAVEVAGRVVVADDGAWCGYYRYCKGRFKLDSSAGPELRAPTVIDRREDACSRLVDRVVKERGELLEDPATGWGERCGFAAVVAYPVFKGDQVVGVLLIGAPAPFPAPPDSALLAMIAKILGTAESR